MTDAERLAALIEQALARTPEPQVSDAAIQAAIAVWTPGHIPAAA